MSVVIQANDLGMRFRIASDQSTNLKEYIIKRIQRKISYNTLDALKGVTFSIEKGEVLGVIGVNGAGKSTLLKTIAGVFQPTSGSMLVKGEVAPLLELGSGFDPELTAIENIYLNGALLGYSEKFINEKIDDIIKFAELEKFVHEKISRFSSGMVARLAFAIATAREVPDILLLDEILSVGDMFFRNKSEARMQEMIRGGATVILVSHSMDTILKNCTKVLWLEHGQVVMFGDTDIVCQEYSKSKLTGDKNG